MIKILIIAFILSFIYSIILGPIVLPILRKIKAGQTEREDGPESHLKKTGTPTMGAFIFLISVILTFITLNIYTNISYNMGAGMSFVNWLKFFKVLPVLLMTLGFAVVGFIDDFIKVVLKRSLGLRAWQKMLLQIVIAVAFVLYLYNQNTYLFSRALVPFTAGYVYMPAVVFIPLAVFIIVGTVNGSNFTDGVDGLETGVTSAICLFFAFVAVLMHDPVSLLPVVFFGALLGFLMFNVNKALVFMGDTGSLALGGLVAGLAFVLNLEFYLPVFALIYFVEVLSVIIQVGYFKLTHGKRIFRMAPIHHHFELGGWTEAKVVAVFTTVTLILCAFTLYFLVM